MKISALDIEAVLHEAARRRLLDFARYVMRDFAEPAFIRAYYAVLDAFAKGRIKRLIVSMPPQHGKSQGSTRLLPCFLAGRDPRLKIAIATYNYTVSGYFNRDIQRIMDSAEYRAVFPRSALASASDTTRRRNSDVLDLQDDGRIMFVGRGGGLTSQTVDVLIMDDLYKDYAEANSPIVRDAAWNWYLSVSKTRLHNDSRELIVFTRWHKEDIIGRISETGEIRDIASLSDLDGLPRDCWARLNFPAIKEGGPSELDGRAEGVPLWPERHSLASLMEQKNADPVLFRCLYQGQPQSAEGRLYAPFKTYADRSEYGVCIRKGNYTDVADEGDDYTVSVCYDVCRSGETYYDEGAKRFRPLLFALVTDIVMSQDNTDVTGVTVPEMINRNGTQYCYVESNSGGSQFEKLIRKKVRATTIPFSQRANKESRIVTSAAMVNAQIVFPVGWETRYPAAYAHLRDFLRYFKGNAHDDIEDVLTGIYEKELADGDEKGIRRGGVRRLN